MRRRRTKAPDWTEANAHDPGVTLVEFLTFLGETLTYSEKPRRRRRRQKLAVAALVMVAVWRARANRERPD